MRHHSQGLITEAQDGDSWLHQEKVVLGYSY
jgi:hypothetical protein